MKKEHRDAIISDLIKRAEGKDLDEGQNALFQMALILELSNQTGGDNADIYSENLDRNMLRLRLNDTEQAQIVEVLVRLIATHHKRRSGAFWTMSKVRPQIALPPLLAVLVASGDTLADVIAAEAVRVLDHCLIADANGQLDEQTRLHLKDNDIVPLLEAWAESDDDRLSLPAERLLDLLESQAN